MAVPKVRFSEAGAIHALSRYFDWDRNWVIPNAYIAGGEMDLAVITRAHYLTEVEIKRTLSDWRADEHKRKWKVRSRTLVSRFFYAVPPELVAKEPAFVPRESGIICVDGSFCRVVREAKRKRTNKLDDQQMIQLLGKTYFRYWKWRERWLLEGIRNERRKRLRLERQLREAASL